MDTIYEAINSLRRVRFNEDQKRRSIEAYNAAKAFLTVLYQTAQPSADLTKSVRRVEEAIMWHSKAIAREAKEQE